MRINGYALVLIIALAFIFIRTALHFGTEGFESEIYELRICKSDSCHLRPQFNDMKAIVRFMRIANKTPGIDYLIPDRWDEIEVLPKKLWIERMKIEKGMQ